jgi:diguanylate cyclase (GGDEF)-like protein
MPTSFIARLAAKRCRTIQEGHFRQVTRHIIGRSGARHVGSTTIVTQRADNGDGLAVLFLGIDDLKSINDTLGYGVGDMILAGVAERLRRCVPRADTVARIGSDEFAVILADIKTPDDAGQLAEKIAEAIAVREALAGQQIVVDLRIGVALAPNDGSEPELLFSNAHLALQNAKTEGRGAWCFFESGMNDSARARRLLTSDLRKALAAEQFEISYQPLFNLADQAVCSFEALLRWRHPERGVVLPGEFIPLAEQIELIVPLGAWVLHQACHPAASWPGQQRIAVNVLACSILQADAVHPVSADFIRIAATTA